MLPLLKPPEATAMVPLPPAPRSNITSLPQHLCSLRLRALASPDTQRVSSSHFLASADRPSVWTELWALLPAPSSSVNASRPRRDSPQRGTAQSLRARR